MGFNFANISNVNAGVAAGGNQYVNSQAPGFVDECEQAPSEQWIATS